MFTVNMNILWFRKDEIAVAYETVTNSQCKSKYGQKEERVCLHGDRNVS